MVTFVRNHPVMFNPIYPVGRRPLVVRTNADYRYTSVAVDQVAAADGNYQVLFLGTGESQHRCSKDVMTCTLLLSHLGNCKIVLLFTR